MSQKNTNLNEVLNRIPPIGILYFILIYFFSSNLYPGGSQADINSVGFDWLNNYWCNLLNEKGMNGQVNPARPYSILAMVLMCFSLMVFFLQFANTYSKSFIWSSIIKIGGVFSMFFAVLIFTQYHDLMIRISSLFGAFVLIGVFKELFGTKLLVYKISAVFCILLLGINNYIYYSNNYLEFLPLLQKITFAIVLLWVVGLNHEIIKKWKSDLSNS